MVQEPAPVMCTVEPLTVQLPRALKLTARPDDAVALTLKSGSPKVFPASGAKLMVWSALFTTWTKAGEVLGADVSSPSYDAVIECEPVERVLVFKVACPF